MSTRKPNSREMKALHRFVGVDHIEHRDSFAGCGEKTFADMIEMGWIEWVEAPETFEEGYRLTEKGDRIRS